MTIISIVYSSGTGHTARMAQAVSEGCLIDGETDVHLLEISDDDFHGSRWVNEEILKTLDSSDAIIFGSPTYMGSVSSKMKAFMEASVSRYIPETWNDKIAAGFTVSGAQGGDKLNTLMTMTTFAMQHGMIWIGLGCNPFNNDKGVNEAGYYYGATGVAGLDDDPKYFPTEVDLESGRILGKRVSLYAKRFLS